MGLIFVRHPLFVNLLIDAFVSKLSQTIRYVQTLLWFTVRCVHTLAYYGNKFAYIMCMTSLACHEPPTATYRIILVDASSEWIFNI